MNLTRWLFSGALLTCSCGGTPTTPPLGEQAQRPSSGGTPTATAAARRPPSQTLFLVGSHKRAGSGPGASGAARRRRGAR